MSFWVSATLHVFCRCESTGFGYLRLGAFCPPGPGLRPEVEDSCDNVLEVPQSEHELLEGVARREGMSSARALLVWLVKRELYARANRADDSGTPAEAVSAHST